MAAALRHLSSISFSGAGSLTIYHLGVAQCLIENGILSLDPPNDTGRCDATTILTGVSGGALVASALVCGISPERSVEVILEVAAKTRQQIFNIYHPGYSLIDVVEQNLLKLLNSDMDADQFQERLKGGRLRIGLTDGRVFPPLGHNPEAYRYIDSFQSVEEIVAACVLSSYIPGATGPLLSSSVMNPAVRRSQPNIDRTREAWSCQRFLWPLD